MGKQTHGRLGGAPLGSETRSQGLLTADPGQCQAEAQEASSRVAHGRSYSHRPVGNRFVVVFAFFPAEIGSKKLATHQPSNPSHECLYQGVSHVGSKSVSCRRINYRIKKEPGHEPENKTNCAKKATAFSTFILRLHAGCYTRLASCSNRSRLHVWLVHSAAFAGEVVSVMWTLQKM